MSYKSISISENAYEKLNDVKSDDETMNDVILRLLRYTNMSKHKHVNINPFDLKKNIRRKEQDKKQLDRISETNNQFRK